MIKNVFNYLAIPLAICTVLILALYPESKVYMSKYSTDGIELNSTVSKDLAQNFNETENYSPFLGKTYVGF